MYDYCLGIRLDANYQEQACKVRDHCRYYSDNRLSEIFSHPELYQELDTYNNKKCEYEELCNTEHVQRIPRKVFSSDLWNEKRVFSRYEALTDLYQSADFNTRRITVSLRSLADRWRWEYKKVMRFMAMLEEEGYVRASKDKSGTTVEIIDPDADGTPDGTPNGTPDGTPKSPYTKGLRGVGGTPDGTPNGTPDGTPSRAYKNDNYISCLNEELNKNIPPLSPKGGNKYDWSIVDDEFKPIVEQWLTYKKEKRQTYKPTGFKTFYRTLVKLSNGNKDTALLIIEQSMANNYSGIFELKTKHGTDIRTNYQNNGHPSDNEMVGIALDVIEEFKAKRRNSG